MITKDVKLGKNVKIYHPDLVNLYGCTIGNNCVIGAFVEIRKQVKIGNNVKIQAFAFIPELVTIGDGVFIGPHVCFINEKHPKAVDEKGKLLKPMSLKSLPTLVKKQANIGAGAIIMCGVTIGKGAIVGAGAVVVKNIPDGATVIGNPARILRKK